MGKNLLLAMTTLAAMLASTPGHALSFDFSFSNVSGPVNGTVTGVVEGLTDNATSSATDVIVQSYPAGVTGLPAAPFDVPTGGPNSFTVSNGSITKAEYVNAVPGPGEFCLSFGLSGLTCGTPGDSFLTNGPAFVLGPVTFTPVPGPIAGAGLPGLILACSVLLILARRRRQIA
jgi:hypothetical protein